MPLPKRDLIALAVAVGAFTVMAVLVFLSKNAGGIHDTPVLVALIMVALFAYALISGRVTELSAPGGWAAKFREHANTRVEAAVLPVEGNMDLVPKRGVRDLKRQLPSFGDTRPIVLRLTAGDPNEGYSNEGLKHYMKALGQFPNFKFVIIVDGSGSLIGNLKQEAFTRMLETVDGEELIQAVHGGDEARLKSFPGIITAVATTKSTNAEALAVLDRQSLDALVLVDAATRVPQGVAARDAIVTKLLLGLAQAK
jgi:hypothetical protein